MDNRRKYNRIDSNGVSILSVDEYIEETMEKYLLMNPTVVITDEERRELKNAGVEALSQQMLLYERLDKMGF